MEKISPTINFKRTVILNEIFLIHRQKGCSYSYIKHFAYLET